MTFQEALRLWRQLQRAELDALHDAVPFTRIKVVAGTLYIVTTKGYRRAPGAKRRGGQ